MGASNCEDCLSFQSALRSQLDAFVILATLNDAMGWKILTESLDQLLKNAEQKRNEVKEKGKELQMTVSKEIVSNSTSGQPQKEIVKVLEEESHKEEVNQEVDEPLSWRKRRRRRGWKGWEKKCRDIVESLWSHEDAFPFRHPVLPTDCPDYGQVIDRPMCLELVKERLERSVYKGPPDFDVDVLLIFQNSRTYNTKERSEIRRMTSRLQNFYESNVQRLEMLSDWKASSKLGKRSSFCLPHNSNGEVKTAKIIKKDAQDDNSTKLVHDQTQPGESGRSDNKNRVRGGGTISCKKCFKVFNNYDILGIHALKCKGRVLVDVDQVAKKRQGQKALAVAKRKMNMKLKLDQKRARQKKIQERQKLRKTTKNLNKRGRPAGTTKKLGQEKKFMGKLKYEEVAAGLVIRNAFPGFNLRRAMGVKVQVEPLRLRYTYFQTTQHSGTYEQGQSLTPQPVFGEEENFMENATMSYDAYDDTNTSIQLQESFSWSEFGGTAAHNTSASSSLSMMVPPVEEDEYAKSMSDMVLDKLVGHHYYGSPMKMVHELNWADIESRAFLTMDEGDFMSSHYQNGFASSLVPVEAEFEHDYLPGSSLMPLTPITMHGANSLVGGHNFYQNSFH